MSDALEKLLAKARSNDLFDEFKGKAKAPEPTGKNAVRADAFDRQAYAQTLGQVPVLRRQMEELGEKHPTSPWAYEDLFNLLNQGDPRFHAMPSLAPEFRPQYALMKGFDEAEDMKWVRGETQYDEFNTALALISMQERIEKSFDDMKDLIDQIQEASQALAEAIKNGEISLESGEGEPQALSRLEDAIAQMLQAQGLLPEIQQAMEEAAAEAVADARGEIEAENEQMSAFGVDKGQLQKMDYAQRKALSERLHKSRMAKLAKIVGAFRMRGDAERRRSVKHTPAEIFDVRLGSDLTSLVGSEHLNMAVPETEDLFWLRFVKNELLTWDKKGPERAGQGPILVLCDESGSMGAQLDAEGNTREAWSKAVTLALIDQARREKRDFTYIGFASHREMWEQAFPQGQQDLESVIALTEHFFAGGTSYEEPMTRAMEIISEAAKRGHTKPDVVFITDAECSVRPEFKDAWNEVRQAADVRCYGIQIGGSGRYSDMADMSDRCIQIERLNASPEGVADLFRTI